MDQALDVTIPAEFPLMEVKPYWKGYCDGFSARNMDWGRGYSCKVAKKFTGKNIKKCQDCTFSGCKYAEKCNAEELPFQDEEAATVDSLAKELLEAWQAGDSESADEVHVGALRNGINPGEVLEKAYQYRAKHAREAAENHDSVRDALGRFARRQ